MDKQASKQLQLQRERGKDLAHQDMIGSGSPDTRAAVDFAM
jgi:hypothetical protein